MLRKLRAQNFRRHENLDISFGAGLTALRGANEQGKSTICECIIYALFGSKSLRTPFADTVTWGKPESSLKVTLTVEAEGVEYTFTRGKSGAEVLYGGEVKVTGQNEVTAFASKLLGADATAASRLMLSPQNGLRGALEQGPKATSEMIENLADFDLFDRLIELMQEKLLLGSSAMLDGRVEQAQAALGAVSMPTKPDLGSINTTVSAKEREIGTLQELLKTLEPASRKASGALESAKNAQRMHENVTNNLRRANEQHALHVEQQKLAEKKAGTGPDGAEIESLRRQIGDADGYAKRVAAYRTYKAAVFPEVHWEGNEASFRVELETARKLTTITAHATVKLESNIKVLRGQVNTGTTCKACGQTLSNLEEIQQKNAELNQQIAAAEADLATAQQGAKEAQQSLNDLVGVESDARRYQQLVSACNGYVTLSAETFPARATWQGEEPALTQQGADAGALRTRLDSLILQKEEAGRQAARVQALAETLVEDLTQIKRLESNLLEFPAVADIDVLAAEVKRIDWDALMAREDSARLRGEIQELKEQSDTLVRDYDTALQRREDMQKQLTQAKEELSTLQFNNNLLKKVRAARPIIADKLWGTVLSAVSTMFSSMRGEKSVITKGKDGFRCNGQAVESLSGSTLDLLGLAIRATLTRTFLPHCPFLILDEPSAACDSDRTNAMLGFIATTGFSQVILVSHDECVEAVADSLIQL